jgi:hypothetical protein
VTVNDTPAARSRAAAARVRGLNVLLFVTSVPSTSAINTRIGIVVLRRCDQFDDGATAA